MSLSFCLFFPLLFKSRYFYCSIFKFTDTLLFSIHFAFEPVHWGVLFCFNWLLPFFFFSSKIYIWLVFISSFFFFFCWNFLILFSFNSSLLAIVHLSIFMMSVLKSLSDDANMYPISVAFVIFSHSVWDLPGSC